MCQLPRNWEETHERRKILTRIKDAIDLNCIYWESKHPDEVKNGVQIPRQKWVFSAEYPHFPRSSSYDEHSLIPCEIEHWDLQTLQACTAALKEGKLTAAVMASPPDHLELQQRTSVSEPASGPQSINPAYQLSPKTLESNHEIEEETYDEYSLDTVKAGLIAIAEAALSRPLDGHTKRAILGGGRGPRCRFTWKFSAQYPCFPPYKKLSRWTWEEYKACIEAIQNDSISVILPSHATVSSHQHGQSSLEDVGKELLADTITKAPRSVNGKTNPSLEASVAPSTDDIDYNDLLVQVTSTASTNMDVLDELVHSIAPFKRNLEVVTRQAGDLEKVVAQLTNVKTAYEDQRRACLEHKKRFEALSSAHSREVETLQKAWVEERTTLTERIDSRNQNRIALYIDARRQGEAEGRQKAIQDIEENRNAQLQSHLEQLERAREEGRQEGIAEGRHLAIKDSELRYAAAIVEAREQGKREGRECPTEEDENLRELLKPYEDDKDPIGERKMHEIKTIYRNWGNIPQNVLPLPMLPVGRTPGEKTLILLARLSKVEPQPEKANALLQQNIHNRNAQNLSGAQIHAITNKDIKRALAHLKKPTYASEANSRDAMLECFSPKESEKVEGSDVRANPVNTDPGQPSAEYSELVLEDGQPGDQTFSSRLYPTDITQAFSESTSSHSRVDQGLDFRSPAGYRNQPSALRHRHTHSPSASSQSQSYKPSTPSRESSLSESDISLMPTGAERISRAFDSYYPSIVEELKCSSKTGLDNNTFNPFKNTPQALSVRESSFRTSKILSRQPPILSGPPSKRKAGADSHLGISGSGKGGKNKSSDLGSVAVSIICSSGSPTPVKEPWENEDLYNASPRTPTRNPGGNSIHSAKTLPSPALLDYPAVKRRKTGEI